MRITPRMLMLTSMIAGGMGTVRAEETPTAESGTGVSFCVQCHGERELWQGERTRLFVSRTDFADDIHWQEGLRCHDCHGGDPTTANAVHAHVIEAGFRRIESPADIPEFCGDCHSNIEYMRRFRPACRTKQLATYWSSGHGQRLKKHADLQVATCVSCHGSHGIRCVDDQQSPVYPTRLAETCATCHANTEVTGGREYHGRPLGHNQVDLWKGSVHAEELLKKGNLAGPTCNDCHGDHGAISPEVDSVANACGQCHAKIASLFSRTRMKHQFDAVGLPGCTTCHGSHDIRSPSDEMLGMRSEAVCFQCHADGRFGAPVARASTVVAMRKGLEQLKARIAHAETELSRAERLGMEVSESRFRLHKAGTLLTNARVLIHSFELVLMRQSLDEGLEVADHVVRDAENTLRRHTARRIWLGVSVIPILIVALLLLCYIRTLPLPTVPDNPIPEMENSSIGANQASRDARSATSDRFAAQTRTNRSTASG